MKEKVDDLKKKVEARQEDLKKKVGDVHKDVNDLQEKVEELLKKVDAQEQQNQKENVDARLVRECPLRGIKNPNTATDRGSRRVVGVSAETSKRSPRKRSWQNIAYTNFLEPR